MILLDTYHLTVLKYRSSDAYLRLTERLQAAKEPVGTSIINVEEQMRGWLAILAKERTVARQVSAYRELSLLFQFFNHLHVLDFTDSAADLFLSLKAVAPQTGSMDLKIASIAIAHNALLLTANERDFNKLPGLRLQNWLLA